MLSKSMEAAINDQITHELYSSHLYLAMSAHFDAANLPGTAHWMRVQAREEQGHAMKFYGYINSHDGRVILQGIDQPPSDFGTIVEAFQHVLEHERKVTGLINQLYAQAFKENDYATQMLLQWFINEQVEEEKNATEIVEQLKLIGTHGTALYMMDRQLASRAG